MAVGEIADPINYIHGDIVPGVSLAQSQGCWASAGSVLTGGLPGRPGQASSCLWRGPAHVVGNSYAHSYWSSQPCTSLTTSAEVSIEAAAAFLLRHSFSTDYRVHNLTYECSSPCGHMVHTRDIIHTFSYSYIFLKVTLVLSVSYSYD